MSRDNQRATAADATASGIESAVNAMNAASQKMQAKMQAMAGECFEISKQSFEHASQTLEKLRGARGMEEIVAIQAKYVKEEFEYATQHARKFGELMAGFPNEFTRTYQDAWFKAVNTAVQTMQPARQTKSDSHADAA